MEKSYGFKGVILLLFLLSACSIGPSVSFDSGSKFSVEVAKTMEEKQKGLMFRESLPNKHGMIFVFDEESPRSFWMKNTLISLDLIYVASNFSVVEIHYDVQPCKEDPCPVSKSVPAQYVLEINSGLAKEHNINVGDRMHLAQ